MEEMPGASGFRTYLVRYLPLAAVLVLVAVVRVRLLQAPLERDEGEYAYMGQLLLKGIPPYAEAYTMKLPGVSFVYAFFMALFGQTTTGIHAGLLLVNGVSMYLEYRLARRVLDEQAALISLAAFALLSLSQSVYGVYAHATHFVVLFCLAGFLLLLRYLDRGRLPTLCASGVCFGMAVLMKQHAVLFLCFAFVCLAWRGRKLPGGIKKLPFAGAVLLVGVVFPYALVLLYVLKAGVFGKFWFWTVQYARVYVSEQTLAQGVRTFVQVFSGVVQPQLPWWLLAGAGAALVLWKKSWCRTDRFFLCGFSLFSFLAICPGLYFREHYFIMLLPAVALFAGAAAAAAGRLPALARLRGYRQYVPVLLLVVSFAYGMYKEYAYYFELTPLQVTRITYGPSPFPEALQVASYLKEHTSARDRIAVLGSEPEVFFYADRLSATKHIYMYGLMEKHRYAPQMQVEMMHDIETAKPKYVVMVNQPSSWGVPPFESRTIINWAEKYAREQYDLVGLVDIVDFNTTHYVWGDDVKGYLPVSAVFLSVLKRKGAV